MALEDAKKLVGVLERDAVQPIDADWMALVVDEQHRGLTAASGQGAIEPGKLLVAETNPRSPRRQGWS